VIGRVLTALVVGDLLLLAAAWYQGGHWMVNTQIAYATSALVMGATLLSYARMVRGRLDAGVIPAADDRDAIERLDDPFDLYSDDPQTDTVKDESSVASAAEIKATIREEKQRLKAQKRSPMTALQDARPFMSLYRLVSYAVLIFGFFYLNGNHLLQPLPYLIGLGLPPLMIVAILMRQKGRT